MSGIPHWPGLGVSETSHLQQAVGQAFSGILSMARGRSSLHGLCVCAHVYRPEFTDYIPQPYNMTEDWDHAFISFQKSLKI